MLTPSRSSTRCWGDRLATLNALVDYATARRYLADYDFIKRDRAGSRNFVNFPRIETSVDSVVLEQVDVLIAAALDWHRQRAHEREARRRLHEAKNDD